MSHGCETWFVTIAVKCPKNGIKYVVNEDGTIGDYIDLIEPEAVADYVTFAEKMIS